MRILVLIKQVPDTNDVKMDEETGTMIREGVGAIINPLDLNALEAALSLRESIGGEVTALSMGPPQAIDAIREAIAMGANHGLLLSSKKFAGADTLATSYTLSEAIKRLENPPDLILAGERAIDGETGQVGVEVAVMLGLPFITYVSKIEEATEEYIRVKRITEHGYEFLESPLPALITVVKEINEPRMPTLSGKVKARSVTVPVLRPEDIQADEDRLGLAGSPTKVVRVFYPKVTRDGVILKTSEHSPEECVESLLGFLESRGLI